MSIKREIKKLSFTNCAFQILSEQKRAMSSIEITDIAIKLGILNTNTGKTPEATMSANMYLEIQRKGSKARFAKIGVDMWCLSNWGKEVIDVEIEKYNEETKEIQLKIKKRMVGDPLSFDGLQYAPINEQGVVFLFGKVHNELGIVVESIQTGFPDAEGRRETHRGWEHVRIEFEYKSYNFKLHKHDLKGCDLIICWEHNWSDCPLEVVELKSKILELQNKKYEK
jgi:HB1, ASXL, restriction endonuclease HTH domain